MTDKKSKNNGKGKSKCGSFGYATQKTRRSAQDDGVFMGGRCSAKRLEGAGALFYGDGDLLYDLQAEAL